MTRHAQDRYSFGGVGRAGRGGFGKTMLDSVPPHAAQQLPKTDTSEQSEVAESTSGG